MPAKKTANATETETKKKTTRTKKAAVKKEAVAEAEVVKAPVKKAPAKRKCAPKKTVKKEVVKETKPEETVVKRTVKDYEDIINWKKGEAHAMDWLYIEINAGDLLTEVEVGVDNIASACNAILNCMLEGDCFIVEPAEDDKVNSSLTVRYYCDNLSDTRKKYFER